MDECLIAWLPAFTYVYVDILGCVGVHEYIFFATRSDHC